MNTVKRVTKNIGILFISQMVSYILGFFIMMYSARYLGVEGFGILSFALAFTGIFSVFVELGLNTLTTREVARDKNLVKEYIDNIISMRIILAIIMFIVMFIIINLLGYNPEAIQVVYIITLYTFFTTFSNLFYAVFQSYEKMEYQSIGNILVNFLLLISVIIAINFKLSIVNFSLIYLVSGIFVLVYALLAYCQKFFLPKPNLNINLWKSLIKEAWPFAVTGVSINLYLWTDTIILSLIQGSNAVGLYNASYKLIMVLLFIPLVFNNAIFPLMSQYYISSKESLNLLFEKLLKTMILIAIPIGVGITLIAQKVILSVYGVPFLGAVTVFQILIWSTVLIFIRSPLERLLESSNKQLVVTKVFILGSLFNVILNLIIIPKYSFLGAGIINVLTDLLILILLILAIKDIKLLASKKSIIYLLKIIVGSLVMGIALTYFIDLNIILLLIIGTITYILSLLALQIFDNYEINIIKSLLK